jgi:hypothetical protein
MRISLLTSKVGAAMYTAATLRHLCKRHGVEIVCEADADALWVSVCDPDDLPVLQRAREIAAGRPVVMGGFESYCGVPYLAWADAVVVGEGFEFIEAWGDDPGKAMELPCVLTRDSGGAIPSYRVDWADVPLVKMPGGNRYYYLSGKGCKGKCKFCLTAWAQPHVTCESARLRGAAAATKGGTINLVSNDSDAQLLDVRASSRSVRVRDYLSAPEKFRATMIHFGIEGWADGARRDMAKPISDDEIRELFRVTGRLKQRMELFFIVGYPGFSADHVESFADNVLPVDPAGCPSAHFKLTYFDPCPHTPWSNEPIGLQFVDMKKSFALLNSRNKRVRVFPSRSQARSAWRTVLHRCAPEQAVALGKCPSDTNNPASMMRFRSWLNCCGLLHLAGRQEGNVNHCIKTRIAHA